jgi:enoyl-CoA hydratase
MSAGPGSARILPPDEVLERLRSPLAAEAFSPLTGDGVLVADLRALYAAPSPEALRGAIDALEQLPCPTLAICLDAASDHHSLLAEAFDVVVASEDALDPVIDTVERYPLASLALVQLLRHSEDLDLHAGLYAESLVYSTLQSGPEFAAWRASHPPRSHADESREPAVLSVRDANRLTLTLNRPEKRNAFSAAMRDALVEGLELAVCDASLAEVVVRGRGPHFCSGGDLDEFGTLPDPATAHAIRSTRHAGRWLAACANRVRVELSGACVGAGIEVPAFASQLEATRDSYFQLPELGLGLVPGAGGTVSLPRRIGRQRTAWLALVGQRIDAETAFEWGLVDKLVDAHEPPDAA